MKKVFLLMVFMSLPLLHDSLIAVGKSASRQATLVIFVLSCATLLNLGWLGAVALFRRRDRSSSSPPTSGTNPLLRLFQIADQQNKVWLGPEIPHADKSHWDSIPKELKEGKGSHKEKSPALQELQKEIQRVHRSVFSGDSDDETEAYAKTLAAQEDWVRKHEDLDPPVTKYGPDEFPVTMEEAGKMWVTGLDPDDPNHRRRYLLARKAIDEPSKDKT